LGIDVVKIDMATKITFVIHQHTSVQLDSRTFLAESAEFSLSENGCKSLVELSDRLKAISQTCSLQLPNMGNQIQARVEDCLETCAQEPNHLCLTISDSDLQTDSIRSTVLEPSERIVSKKVTSRYIHLSDLGDARFIMFQKLLMFIVA
jgi:hypothetical protein